MADSDQDSAPEETAEVSLQQLKQRIDTLEDQVMMERLEDLSIEDEIEVVEDMIGRDREAIQEKLEMLDSIEEKYEETQVDEKLQYLYKQLQSVQDTVEDLADTQVREEEVSELRGRIDRLESTVEQAGAGDQDRNFDDVYDKLYTLRDRLEDLQSDVEGVEGGGGAVDTDEIVRRVESRASTSGGGGPSVGEVKRAVLDDIDVSATGASAREIKEQVLAQIDPGDISDAALDDLRDEIDKLRGRIEAHQEISGGDGSGASDELRTRVAELEGRIEELEHRDVGASEADLDIDPSAIEGLEDDLDALREEVADAAKQDLEDEIEALRADVDELQQAGEETVDPGELAALQDTVEDLDDRLPEEELLESVEYVEEEIRKELSSVQDRVDAVQDSLQEEVAGLREDIEPLQEKVAAIEAEQLEDVEERITELDSRADDIEQRLELDARELLEALEYEGEELEDRFKEILVQIEHLRETIGKQEERIDSLSHAQNMFESHMGEVVQEQQELTERLREEDQKLDRKTDFLLEALEEGLELEEEDLMERLEEHEAEAERSALRTLLTEQIEEVEDRAETDAMGRKKREELLQEAFEEWLDTEEDRIEELAAAKRLALPDDVERELSAATGETGVDALARIAIENQERVAELRDKIEDMEKHAPTVIE